MAGLHEGPSEPALAGGAAAGILQGPELCSRGGIRSLSTDDFFPFVESM